MLADASSAPRRWTDAAREVAPLLNDRTCLVIVAENDVDAAHLAIAIARAEAPTRRVAIVDTVGELPPIQKLLPKDARRHGVIDHFLHGVSLRKIAHPVGRERGIFVIPSGAGPFEYETLLRRERWRRLTAAFRAEGALLCIILPADAAGLPSFVEDTDGVIVIDDVPYPEARHIIAALRSTAAESDVSMATPTPRSQMATLVGSARQALSSRAAAIVGGGAALTAVVALLVLAWGRRAANDTSSAASRAEYSTQAQRAGAIADDDSTGAAMYSIDVVMLNSLGDASRHLTDRRLDTVSAATFAPVLLGADSARWYRVLIGAWPEQRQADSALAALRTAGVLESGFGSVRRTPYAVRVDENLTVSEATARASDLRAAGLPAYALQRDEGHAAVYGGAFETPSQAMPLLDMFKRAGIDATVAYRIGRGL
jgi:hypothetical protein